MNTWSQSVNHGHQLEEYLAIQTAYVYCTTLPCLQQKPSCYRISYRLLLSNLRLSDLSVHSVRPCHTSLMTASNPQDSWNLTTFDYWLVTCDPENTGHEDEPKKWSKTRRLSPKRIALASPKEVRPYPYLSSHMAFRNFTRPPYKLQTAMSQILQYINTYIEIMRCCQKSRFKLHDTLCVIAKLTDLQHFLEWPTKSCSAIISSTHLSLHASISSRLFAQRPEFAQQEWKSKYVSAMCSTTSDTSMTSTSRPLLETGVWSHHSWRSCNFRKESKSAFCGFVITHTREWGSSWWWFINISCQFHGSMPIFPPRAGYSGCFLVAFTCLPSRPHLDPMET